MRQSFDQRSVAARSSFGIAPQPRHQVVEVDLVAVEVGAVDAGELDLVADLDAAAAAHAGAVDHDRGSGSPSS